MHNYRPPPPPPAAPLYPQYVIRHRACWILSAALGHLQANLHGTRWHESCEFVQSGFWRAEVSCGEPSCQ